MYIYICVPYENADDWGMENMDGANIIYVSGILWHCLSHCVEKFALIPRNPKPNRRVGWAQKWDTPDTPQQNTSKYQ